MQLILKVSLKSFIFFDKTTADEMDVADDELRETIRMIWPLQADKMVDLLVPRRVRGTQPILSTGKIYAGLLILESWRTTRFQKPENQLGVSYNQWIINNTYRLKYSSFSFCYFFQSRWHLPTWEFQYN